jgi:hypothetical protein
VQEQSRLEWHGKLINKESAEPKGVDSSDKTINCILIFATMILALFFRISS